MCNYYVIYTIDSRGWKINKCIVQTSNEALRIVYAMGRTNWWYYGVVGNNPYAEIVSQ